MIQISQYSSILAQNNRVYQKKLTLTAVERFLIPIFDLTQTSEIVVTDIYLI